jgi:ABC-type antimicrobial peptide transport system permease subunit
MTVVARLEPWRRNGASAVVDAIRTVDPQQPAFVVRMMDEWVTRSVAQPRFSLMLLSLFAGLSVLLAAVGVYGVMASMVARRTRELGIRLALGGQPASLLQLVLRRSLSITAVGLLAGLVGGLVASAALGATFVDAQALDPLVFVVVMALVLTVSVIASYVPARRAMRVDPVEALRL